MRPKAQTGSSVNPGRMQRDELVPCLPRNNRPEKPLGILRLLQMPIDADLAQRVWVLGDVSGLARLAIGPFADSLRNRAVSQSRPFDAASRASNRCA